MRPSAFSLFLLALPAAAFAQASDSARADTSSGARLEQKLDRMDGKLDGIQQDVRVTRRELVESRSRPTTLLATTLAGLQRPPGVLLSASAVGWYGSRGDEVLDETSAAGTDFLAGVCREWEAATAPAEAAGVRVAHLRTGIVLSARGELDDRIRGLDLGADDYMVKPFDVDELEARVRMLLRRQAGLKATTLSVGSVTLDLSARSFSSNGAPIDIPARERSLLETLFLRSGKVVTKQAIVESLAGFDDDLSANAIEQYVSRLRKRLAPYRLTVRTARGIGYYLEPAKPE